MEIAKFKSHFSTTVVEQIHRYVQSGASTFARLRAFTAERVRDARCKSEKATKTLRAWLREAVVLARPKIMSFKSHAAIAGKLAVGSLAGSLQRSRDTLRVVGDGASNTLQKVRNTSGKSLHTLRTASYEAAVAANGKIKKLGLQVSAATKHIVAPVQKAQTAVVGLGKIVAKQPHMRREERRAKENEVRELLVDSRDAVILTDVEKRLVAANPAALNLLGISEFNLKNFTIDAFLAQNLLLEFAGNGSTLRSHAERRSQCKIRRLDGRLQVAECVFVAHALPYQHLYKFLNAVPYRIAPPGFGARNAGGSTSRGAEGHGNSVTKASKAASKLPRHGVRPVI